MIYFLLIFLTLLSCVLFDLVGVPETVRTLITSYRTQLNIMNSRSLNDEEKQKALLQQMPVQLVNLLKLILGIFLFISPFILLYLFDQFISVVNAKVLYHIDGILVSCIAVILYVIIKKKYGQIFKGRKNTS